MKKYRVGIVGFGWVAEGHLLSFLKSDRYQPIAVMSTRNLDPANFKKQWGVDLKIYNDYEQFLKDPEIDVVDICTPHFLHPEQTIQASEAGKAVIIEKPIALNYEDSKRMFKTVKKNKTRTSVCFEVRYISSVLATQSIIAKGLIGDIYYAEADYYHGIGPWYKNQRWEVKKEFGGSSLLRAGCHALDIILFLIGEEVEEVFAYGNKNPNPVYQPYDYDLNTVVLLKFKTGKLAKVSSCTDCAQPYVFNINILGSEGSIKNDQFYSKKIDGMKGWSKLNVQLIDSGDVLHHPYKEQFDDFALCLDTGIDPHNNLESAFYTHKVVFAADLSASEGRPIKLSEFN
ncbi:MAG: Gfo/Idh/MocA family oxidoreductase [Candidatus Atribacteria bacterium]|nr:Gfo/Idh/MocA family oxidoreductase [Candidatus Atribacteria bacterium]